jgi:hypothetical protein
MSTPTIPDSLSSIWPLLVRALQVLATKNSHFLAHSARGLSFGLDIVGERPLAEALRRQVKEFEAREGSIGAALWMLQQEDRLGRRP